MIEPAPAALKPTLPLGPQVSPSRIAVGPTQGASTGVPRRDGHLGEEHLGGPALIDPPLGASGGIQEGGAARDGRRMLDRAVRVGRELARNMSTTAPKRGERSTAIFDSAAPPILGGAGATSARRSALHCPDVTSTATAPNDRYTADRARRLALIRYMLQRAEQEAELSEPLHVPALLLLHDAAELLIVLVAEATNAAVKSGMDFLAYWDVIDGGLAPDKLGHKAEMAVVNKARVGLKHAGVIPTAAEVRRYATMTRSFVEDAAVVVFGTNLDQASLADLVPSVPLRTALKEAEAAIATSDIPGALGKARIAFELTLREDDERIRQLTGRHPLRASTSRLPSAFSLGLQQPLREFGRAWDDLIAVVKRTDDAVRLMAKGIDYGEYMRFAALTPHAYWTLGNENPILSSDGSEAKATIHEASWAVDFAIRTALSVLS